MLTGGMGPPGFNDDGTVHNYSIIWHPDYIAIQKDGVTIQLVAKNWVPSVWMQFLLGTRSFDDPDFDQQESALYVNKISYDSDISKLPKLV